MSEPVPLIRCTMVPPCGKCWYCEQAAKPKPAHCKSVYGTYWACANRSDGPDGLCDMCRQKPPGKRP